MGTAAGATGGAGGTARPIALKVLECFFATSLSKKSRHSMNRLPRLVLASQQVAMPLLAIGSTVKAYTWMAAHWARVECLQPGIPWRSILRLRAFRHALYSGLKPAEF